MSNGLIVIPNWPNFCSRATVDTIFLLLLLVVLKSLVFCLVLLLFLSL